MILNGIANLAEQLAYELDEAGIALSPLPGTLIAATVGACQTKTTFLADPIRGSENNYKALAGTYLQNVMQEIQADDVTNFNRHDSLMAEAVRAVGGSIKGNLHDAQNIVLPLVKEVSLSVEQTLREAIPSVANVLSVQTDDYGDIWDDQGLLSAVEKYSDAIAIGTLRIPSGHRSRSEAEVLDLLKTGSAKFDKVLQGWATQNGSDVATRIYREIFVEGYYAGEGQPNATPLDYFMGQSAYDRVRLVLVHFMARKLRLDVDEGLNMSANDYDYNMACLIAETGRGITRVIEKREREDRANRLIVSWPYDGAEKNAHSPESATIVVNADVYKRWLTQGGRPEILMGSFVVDRESDPEVLLQRGEKYIEAWTRRAELIRSAHQSQRHTTTVIGLRDAMRRAINELDENHVGPGGKEGMRSKLSAVIGTLRDVDTTDVYKLSREVVCLCMFEHRQSLEILIRMDATALKNPSIDIREIALMVTLEMLCEWAVDHFVVHSVQ